MVPKVYQTHFVTIQMRFGRTTILYQCVNKTEKKMQKKHLGRLLNFNYIVEVKIRSETLRFFIFVLNSEVDIYFKIFSKCKLLVDGFFRICVS